jgi:hypothetical protein
MSVHDAPPTVDDHPKTCPCLVCYCLRLQDLRRRRSPN